ncbi:CYTH domain-containing protein [Pseudomonas aeruginosa]
MKNRVFEHFQTVICLPILLIRRIYCLFVQPGLPQEIERKFLVKPGYVPDSFAKKQLVQAYLSDDLQMTVRVRIEGAINPNGSLRSRKAFNTVKGKGSDDGMSRPEIEYRMPLRQAAQIIDMCRELKKPMVEKIRHLVRHEGHIWEIDQLQGANEGLWIAEIELASRDEDFVLPEWVDREVTGDKRYYNLALAKSPFTTWKNEA